MAINFNQYASEGNKFLKDYTYELNLGEDRDKAGRILVSTLHALRDIIPMQESLQFIAQLPMFLKGLYVHGWSSKKKKIKIKHVAEFLDLVRHHDGAAAVNDFEYDDEVAERYIKTTFIFLRKYVSLGEMEDIMDNLPKELKHIIYYNVLF
ncbi:uncharacterized protein (DUF2267 family) [Saonia flava]|uniref:Uncharacterized protein (DUF2267 family) n=1 Tax=Saonia flava TaxID=523696 RepID=A0A846QZ28_9FLAO|nr:DUF2267 domain-containing protein [Saonia flava]NJB72180.1 uncharacterized protein (DUF2267 family) [Saonia flava]